MSDLHTKYRPDDLDLVIGQDEVVASLSKVLQEGKARAFIFTGPAGVGKTTLARIIANRVGCASGNVIEIDAAVNSGVDAMRSITELTRYSSLGSNSRVLIVDEAHALSKAAWQSMLKSVEEPPEGVYWVFCTTEAGRIPETIKTRCIGYTLKPVRPDTMLDLLRSVGELEGMKVSDKIMGVIARASNGSVRRALTSLAKCQHCKEPKEVLSLMETIDDGDGSIIELCRALAKGIGSWSDAMKLIEPLKDTDANALQYQINAYFTKAAMGAKSDEVAQRALAILEVFSTPYPPNSGIGPLILSLGRLLLT